MKYIENITTIIDQYELFLIDINGVVHDGISFYSHALNFLSLLLKKNKKILFLSNAPRPSSIFVDKLSSVGYHSNTIRVVTSGDFFIHKLQEIVKKRKKILPCHIICQERNADLILNDLIIPSALNAAEYLLLLGFTNEDEQQDRYDHVLRNALQNNLMGLCPNPDTIAVLGEGVCYPAGLMAKRYEAMGGTVTYYGKPYTEIYKFALKHYEASVSNNAILAIGDNMKTDIVGAHNAGIDSLLVSYGVHINEPVEEILHKYDILPTYILRHIV